MNNREINRYSISSFDFEQAIKFAREAKNYLPNNILYESLLISSVISYARPFSNNEKNKKGAPSIAKLEIRQIIAPTEIEIRLHDRLMELRNKAIAHSEWGMNPTSFKSKGGVYQSRVFSIISENLNLDDIIELSEKLRNACHAKRADFSRNFDK